MDLSILNGQSGTAGGAGGTATDAAINSIFGGGMTPIPSLTGGAGGAAGPSDSKGGTVGGAAFDNSGWNITFGNNSGVESSRSQAAAMSDYFKYALLAGALIVAVKWIRAQKNSA